MTPTYDAKGNLTSAGGATYGYSSENMLTSASGGITLAYDPMLRLYQTAGGSAGTTRFAYDGADLIAEHNSSNAMLRRYVHGPGSDEPLVWYEGSGTSDRRFLHADERGSVIATSNSSGTTLATNAYDEYGIPKSTNSGRFQYTGQTWLPELGMYHYKARIYSPTLGRFLQTDPIGYGDGMNLYAYVGNDPVNFRDPMGLCSITVWGRFLHNEDWTEVILLDIWAERSGCDGSAGDGRFGSGDGGSGGGSGSPDIPCDPKESDVFGSAKEATIGAARATAIRNNQNGSSAYLQEFHARVGVVPGGFSFVMTKPGPESGGSVDFTLRRSSVGSAHNHEAADSYLLYPGRLSSDATNTQGRITMDNDVRAYQQFFDKAGAGSRDRLHIAIAGPDGRTYHWAPGSNLKQPGKDAGSTLCK